MLTTSPLLQTLHANKIRFCSLVDAQECADAGDTFQFYCDWCMQASLRPVNRSIYERMCNA